ncbi:MAG: transposase [Candidatus Acidiferrales bacterium]
MKDIAASRSDGRIFRLFDAVLDRGEFGQLWLKDRRIASCVVQSLQHGEAALHEYKLHAFVVMPNHVHVLLEPRTELRRITQGIKGTTSRRANAILRRVGQPFWQDESFDRWIRNEDEFLRIRHYILRNPVAAGLVKTAEEWPWSSLRNQ